MSHIWRGGLQATSSATFAAIFGDARDLKRFLSIGILMIGKLAQYIRSVTLRILSVRNPGHTRTVVVLQAVPILLR